MKYDIKAKPTKYNGINFRSMLEARWAYFFDLVEWEWEYEPYEINGRLPDFIIYSNSDRYDTKTIIVEIKPKSMITDKFKKEILKSYKNEQSHLLLLHESPFKESKEHLVSLGLISQYVPTRIKFRHREFYDADMKCVNDFGSNYMIFDGMIGNQKYKDRKIFIDLYTKDHYKLINMWKECQNSTKFKTYNNG